MIAKLQAPSSQVTDLGRMLLGAGNTLGSFIGMPTIFGSGDYAITQNSLWDASAQVPFMHSSNNSITLRHREYITDIAMNGPTFTAINLAVNPGLPATFPYLSAIAANFQEYEFTGLVFEYKPTSSTALSTGTNTAMGSVMLAFQYRADALPFPSKVELLNEMWSVDSPPSSSAVLPLECAPKENPFKIQYVRSEPPTGDIKMFDFGNLVVATSGGQAGQTNIVGELWASYECILRKPRISPQSTPVLAAHFSAPAWSNAIPLGTDVSRVIDFNTLGVKVSQGQIEFPAHMRGTYILVLRWRGGAANTVLPILTGTNFNTLAATAVLGTGFVELTWQISFTLTDETLPGILAFGGLGTLPVYSGAGTERFTLAITPGGFPNWTFPI
jgi:hypothetical protein